jgi:catechol 2,3-dioxygenase
MDPAMTMGVVHLTIADLQRSIAFYETRVGLRVNHQGPSSATLGVERRDLITLVESATARRAVGATGLYHFAILVPSRVDLARSLRHFIDTSTRMQGFADHGVSEALYLADPDGNGIEIYRDRPRDEWQYEAGSLRMGVDPLDLGDLLADIASQPDAATPMRLPAGTRMGHVHLQVSQLDDAERFYVGILGLDITARYTQQALFVSAGGYHHHLGLNTWLGVGAPAPPPGAIGLRHFEMTLSTESAREAVLERLRAARIGIDDHAGDPLIRDPSANALVLRVAN